MQQIEKSIYAVTYETPKCSGEPFVVSSLQLRGNHMVFTDELINKVSIDFKR